MKPIRSLTIRLLTICLALSLCLATATPVLAAGNDVNGIIQKLMTVFNLTQNDYNNYDSNYAASLPVVYDQKSSSHYVAMGGSSAAGMAGVNFNNCYPTQVASKLGIQYSNIANTDCNAATAVDQVKSNSATVAKADLITFQLDAAPFILACADDALDGTPVVWDAYITDQALITSLRDFRTQLVNEYGATCGRESAEIIASLVEHLLYECVAYCFETVNAVNEIRKHNTSAVVLVLGLYNPLRNLVFNAGAQSLDISNIMDQMIDFCNVFLLKRISSMENTAFVEACDANTTGFGPVAIDTQNQNAAQKEMLKIVNASNKQYANKDGHDYMRNQVLNALTPPCKHTNTTIKNARPASCKEEGYTGDTVCATCNTTVQTGSAIQITDHNYGAWTQSKAPGCTTEGEQTCACTVCGKTTTQPVPAAGHSWNEGVVTTAPGCETEGEEAVTCTVCGKATTQAIPATGHSWNKGTVITPPGCETDGEEAVTCTVCSKETTQAIPATGHSWNEGTVITPPGCETEGEEAVTCTVCGKASTQPVPATGHNYGNYLSNEDATCQKDGTKTAVCDVCGATDTQIDPGTQKKHSYDKGVCAFCGAEKPSNGTIWWILISVLVVAAAAAGVLFFLKWKKQQSPKE